MSLHFPISNAARSVGARLSGEIARRLGNDGLPGGEGRIQLTFHGVAGQSFGAFNSKGVKLVLRGDAHDYVGKCMHGGTIVLAFQSAVATSGKQYTPYPLIHDPSSTLSVICGNTCLYGATGGRFFAAGRGGERFAVRNSGATAVVEGVGDNGCEYMTRGLVVVLGSVGRNFAAGMSGGKAYVYDIHDTFLDRYNPVSFFCEPPPFLFFLARKPAQLTENAHTHARTHSPFYRREWLSPIVCPPALRRRLSSRLSSRNMSQRQVARGVTMSSRSGTRLFPTFGLLFPTRSL